MTFMVSVKTQPTVNKIVNSMTPGTVLLMIGRGHISHTMNKQSSSLLLGHTVKNKKKFIKQARGQKEGGLK